MKIYCVSCKQGLNASETMSGRKFKCPKCKVAQTAPIFPSLTKNNKTSDLEKSLGLAKHLENESKQEIKDVSKDENSTKKNPLNNYGDFWKRLAAFVIDGFFLTVMLEIVFAVAGSLIDEFSALAISNFIGFIIVPHYFALFESSAYQATLGKRIMGLCVVSEEGKRISLNQAMFRWIMKYKSAVLFMVGFLMQPFTAKKQTLHDMRAGTIVVKKQKLADFVPPKVAS